MIGRLACVMVVMAAAASPAPPPGVTRHALEGALRIDTVLPGALVSYVMPAIGGGRREILMLVEPEGPPVPDEPAKPDPCQPSAVSPPSPDPPRWLYRLELTGDDTGGTLTRLRDDLPADAEALDALDLDGDGADEILLTRPGALHVLRDRDGRRAGGGPDPLMSDPAILENGSGHLEPSWLRRPAMAAATILPFPFLGGVRFYGPGSEGLSWDLLHEAPLTLEAERSSGGLRLSSRKIQAVGIGRDGDVLFASGPEADGGRRLRSVLFNPAAAGQPRHAEVWSALPGLESIVESRYLTLDGRPALVVTTRPAEKLSIFGEKMLRVFLLDEPDRSRGGVAPILAVDSHMNLWQAVTPVAHDVNGDGLEDLVVGYWKGLKDSRVMLDVYLRESGGAFGPSPATTGFDVEDGDRSFVDYGRDLDGDGNADLLLRSGAGILIHPGGAASRGGRDLVDRTPRFTIPMSFNRDNERRREPERDFSLSLGGGSAGGGLSFASDPDSVSGGGLPRAVDLDGDGIGEIVMAVSSEKGRGRFQVIRLAPR